MQNHYIHFAYSKHYQEMTMEQHMEGHCGKRAQTLERFLEISLLVLLYDRKGHGYSLMEQLGDFGFDPDQMNIGSLYRILRNMEKSSLVLSDWEQGEGGPRRRVYEITEEGKSMLSIWSEHVRKRKSAIEYLLDTYEKKLMVDEHPGED